MAQDGVPAELRARVGRFRYLLYMPGEHEADDLLREVALCWHRAGLYDTCPDCDGNGLAQTCGHDVCRDVGGPCRYRRCSSCGGTGRSSGAT